jgi:type II secretory pathway pseudopilin PulG
MKNNKGITLVALVVTIVVLLILAGVSINLVLGNNGIIAKAKDAETKSAEASQNDLIGMNELAQQLEEQINGSTGNGGKTEPETVPYLPSDDFHYDTSTSVDTGLVIKDGSGNEYVWVVVPRTTAVYATTGLGKITFTDADYTSIENDLKEYTKTYRGSTSYSDTWYADDKNEGWLTPGEYTELKNSMLKSVYENGGFYVGRYEAGIGTNRTSNTDKNSDGKYTMPSTVPVSKADAYPYTRVTRTQAQNLASNVNSGTKTSSLMFGVQWDLVLAFMHNKGNIAVVH